MGEQGGRAGGSLEQVGGRVTTHKRFDIAAVVCGSPPSLPESEKTGRTQPSEIEIDIDQQ